MPHPIEGVDADPARAKRRFRFAKWAIIGWVVFASFSLLLKAPTLAPYPGAQDDPLMKVLTYTVFYVFLATIAKFVEMKLFGRWIERETGRNRPVRSRDIFSPVIQRTAFIGGALHAAYAVMLFLLVAVLAPAALASVRACIVLGVVTIELRRGLITRSRRLAQSLLLTVGGAALVIFAGGFTLFKGDAATYIWVLLAVITIGNLAMGIVEDAERRGVRDSRVAAPVYTMTRYLYFLATCIVATVTWGSIGGRWDVFWASVHMCIDRLDLILPVAILGGLSDLLRICVKTVISATYMYVVGGFTVILDAALQAIAHAIWPAAYPQVHSGWAFTLQCILGGILVVWGAKCFPHPSEEKLLAAEPARK